VAQAAGDRLALIHRQLELGQPPPATHPNTSLTGGRPASRRINTAWISFFARVRARTSWLRRDSRRRIARHHSSGSQTASSSPAANSLASVRASSRSVFARARPIPVSCGLTTTTCGTCGPMIRAISAALPVTSNATRSLGERLPANNFKAAGAVLIRPAERTSPPAAIATSQKPR
jgi:hypothetical protein